MCEFWSFGAASGYSESQGKAIILIYFILIGPVLIFMNICKAVN